MSLNRSIGSAEYMKKKIPKNAKYEHVKTRLDTGCSLTKYMERLEEIKKNYRYRKDEIFKRLKVTTFAQLILQVASVSDLNENEKDSESHSPDDGLRLESGGDSEFASEHTNGALLTSVLSDRQETGDASEVCYTARSTLLSVISGVGELNIDRSSQKMTSELVSSPEPTDRPYTDCPYLLLDVRDRDEYDCCHIISGLRVIAQKFPSGMTTGSIPTSCLSSPTSSKGKKCNASQQLARAAEKRWRFTSDELAKIQEQLEEILIPSNSNSRMSSRMSTSSARSTASSRHSSCTSGRGSARVQSSRSWK
ncbi:centrosomal protein of 41 kDa isoform X2 [Oreochromis niloticus]|uniref:centrosomal protein of 41 kDa isoform X2 n=1 Tax=Oreochromis niloticus TaxID=8128 RepID=UPI00039413E1|nr:centrosomal protein of 41 kDa isoform X2 [Oreochromis niloticus]